jgi:hypothetical protein
MEELYMCVDATRMLEDKAEIFEDTIMKILLQTVECVIFIREYCGHGFCGNIVRLLMPD